MNTSSDHTKDDSVKHSKPIPISTQHLRHRSFSTSSDSSRSPTTPPQNITPPRIPSLSPSSSPILQFLSQSPAKSSATFPFRGFGPLPVFEGVSTEEAMEELPATAHARRSSVSGRFAQQPPVTDGQHERGVNLLRRLSLGSALTKPPPVPNGRCPSPPRPVPPPNTAVTSPVFPTLSVAGRKPKRSATVTETGRPRRPPSPMGERMLKGHFDGF
ncbi:hypothetical protein V8B97DRAFT_2017133 [Scleroderma yunnanense]